MVTPTDANILPPPPCVTQENNEDHQTDSQQQEIIDMVEAAQGLPYMDEGGIFSHFRFNILETSFMDTCNFMNLIIVCHAPPPAMINFTILAAKNWSKSTLELDTPVL